MLLFEGKKALVTGASRRIGRAVALQLAKEGCFVAIHYKRSAADAGKLLEEVERAGGSGAVLQSGLEDEASCSETVSRAVTVCGGLDFLVNNASVFPKGDIMTSAREELEHAILVNAWAPLWLSIAFASKVSSGGIVNMLDTRISGYDFSNFPYYLSKRALSDITENLALRFAPSIRVNGVAPGLIIPPDGKDESYLSKIEPIIPLRAHGSVEDIANAVSFLLRSNFITGQTIFVDGGQHLTHHVFGGRSRT